MYERGVGLPAEKAKKAPLPMDTSVVPYWLVDAGYVPRELSEEEEGILSRVRTERAKEFLRWFPRLGTSSEVCKRVGVGTSAPTRWRERDEAFAELYKRLQADVVAVMNDVALKRALDGFEDRMFNADGDLVGMRKRQDPSFFTKFMAKVDEDWRPVDQGTQVMVQVVVAPE